MTEGQEIEYFRWQDRLYEVECLRERISDYDKRDVIRGYDGDEMQPTYDKIDTMFDELEAAIRGRLNELDEEYCIDPYPYAPNGFYEYHEEAARYAQLLGINFVAVEHEARYGRFTEVMEYIRKQGQASMSYDKTVKAVRQYNAYREMGFTA